MILIITEIEDPTADIICKWLTYHHKEWFRINNTDNVELENFVHSDESIDFNLTINSIKLSYGQIKAVYYRRGIINLASVKTNNLPSNLMEFLNEERLKLIEYIHFLLEFKPCIGKFERTGPNKLKVLKLASDFGINTPKTFITQKKEEANQIIEKHAVITKAIFEPISFVKNEYSFSNPTVRLLKEDMEQVGDFFWYSLIQSEVQKKFEVRSFYIMGDFYSMAIISQNNINTTVDYRNYDSSNPNRNLPIKLPIEIEKKIHQLMLKLDYNIGCIDLIYSNSEYIFLEVNPVGQYGMISHPCGYNLEKIVAEKLIQLI